MAREQSPLRRAPGLLAALAMALGPCAALADADGPDFYAVRGVAQGDVLNIRAEPDPHAHKVGEIPPDGTCIRSLGCKGGLTFREHTELSPAEKERRERENPRWCRVEYRGVTGWVAGRYLAEGDCRTSGAGEVPAAPEHGGPRNWEVSGVSGGLHLRERASTTATVVATYAPGTVLDNLGCLRAEDGVWCDVQKLGGGSARLRRRPVPEARGLAGRLPGDGAGHVSFSARKESDLHLIRVGPERYEIPDAVTLGG